MRKLDPIFRSLNAYDESLLEHLVNQLRSIMTTAHNRTIAKLQPMFPGGAIDRAAVNYRLVRKIGDLVTAAANHAGLDAAVTAFAETFDGALTYMDQIYQTIAAGTSLPPKLTFTGDDARIAKALKANAVTNIEDVLTARAAVLGQKVMFSVGGLRFGDLVEMFSENLNTSLGQAQTIAATSQSTFYRTINANQMERIDPDGELKYKYSGPDDRLTRPFCIEQLHRKNPLTRDQIDALDNGQLPDCMATAGGFNCRHQWAIDVADLQRQRQAA